MEYSFTSVQKQVEEVDLDPYEPGRSIVRMLLQMTTIVFVVLMTFAIGVTAVYFAFRARITVPMLTTSYAFTATDEEDLFNLQETYATDMIAYSTLALGLFIGLGSIQGCLSACFHRRSELKGYSISMSIMLVMVATLVILIASFYDLLVVKINEFGVKSLQVGFVGQSDGIKDRKPGGVITYIWQWMQINFQCCGWKHGDEYLTAEKFEQDVKVIDLQEIPTKRANMLLTLTNRVVSVENSSAVNSSSTTNLPVTTTIALLKVLPPSCCRLANTNATDLYFAQDFTNITLYNADCPYTYETSYRETGCYTSFLYEIKTNLYAITLGLGLVILLQVFSITLALKLSNTPSEREWEAECKLNRMNAVKPPTNSNIGAKGPKQLGKKNKTDEEKPPAPQSKTQVEAQDPKPTDSKMEDEKQIRSPTTSHLGTKNPKPPARKTSARRGGKKRPLRGRKRGKKRPRKGR